jgi:hypothetical protein
VGYFGIFVGFLHHAWISSAFVWSSIDWQVEAFIINFAEKFPESHTLFM